MTRTSRSVRGLTTFFLMLLLLGVGNALGAAPDSENLQSTRGEPAVFLNIWISDPKELSLTPLTRLKPNSRYVLVLDVSPQSYESRRVFGESLVSIRASVLEQYLNSQRTADASVHAELSWESQEDHQKSVQGRITVDRRIDDRTISGTSDEHEQAILREDPRFVLGREILSFDTGTQEGTLELRMKMSTTTGAPIGTIVIESCVVGEAESDEACRGYPRQRSTLGQSDAASAPQANPVETLKVYYATDRVPIGAPVSDYATEYSDTLQFGVAKVPVAVDRPVSSLQSLQHILLKTDSAGTLLAVSIDEVTEGSFYSQLVEDLKQTGKRQVLVFVHGYRVLFRNALQQTARIAYDLKFDGIPVLYSWPSQGTLLGYPKDAESVQKTVAHLKKFLQRVATETEPVSIHLLAHSMGNRALLDALKDLGLERFGDKKQPFRDLIFAAPDVERTIFSQRLLDVAREVSTMTLYASSEDQALRVSKWFNGAPRAGDVGEAREYLILTPPLETIDATGLDTSWIGHSYYATQKLLDDLFYLLTHNLKASQRSLHPLKKNGIPYYIFNW